MSETITKNTSGPEVIGVLLTFKPIFTGYEKTTCLARLGGFPARAWSIMLQRCIHAPLAVAGILSAPVDLLGKHSAEQIRRHAGHQGGGQSQPDQTLLVVFVTDWRRGLHIVREELETLGLLQVAQIVYADFDEDIFRNFHPAGASPFDPKDIAREWGKGTPWKDDPTQEGT